MIHIFSIMKKLLFIFMGIVISVAAMAQVTATNPDQADYFIKGRMSVERGNDGTIVYRLYNVEKKGIYFTKYDSYGIEDGESVFFTMREAGTDPVYPGGFEAGLQFWRYDEDIQEWQTDSEFKPSTIDFEETKQMVVTVLIDCSGSLKEEWSVAKEGAIAFIDQMYNVSRGRGNIKIGIIGFSTIAETKVFPIESLTDYSKNRMQDFIRFDLRQSDGTALFYAMDNAVENMEKYCRENVNSSDLAFVSMAIFTDGLDQISRNLDKNILTTDDYRDYVKQLKGKMIGDTRLYSVMFGLKGVDITTDAQLSKFQRIGHELTDKFTLMDNIYQLGSEFSKYGKELTESWQNLKCYAPNSYKGRVAWTFRNAEKPKPVAILQPEAPRKKGKTFFGVNVGLGYSVEGHFAFSGGLDVAFPIKSYSGLGFYLSGGGGVINSYWYSSYFGLDLDIGLLGLVGFDRGGAILLGGGLSCYTTDPLWFGHVGWDYSFNGRVGYKFKKGLYLFAEGSVDYRYLIHIGYAFR